MHVCEKQKQKLKNYEGYCFFYKRIPEVEGAHLIIVISKPVEIAKDTYKSMAVIICSIKDSENFYYDDNCILFTDDIFDKNNREILNRTSYIRYDSTFELENSEFIYLKKHDKLEYRCKVTPQVLNSLKCGAIDTKELKPECRKYVDSSAFLEGLNIEEHRKKNEKRKKIVLEHQQEQEEKINFKENRKNTKIAQSKCKKNKKTSNRSNKKHKNNDKYKNQNKCQKQKAIKNKEVKNKINKQKYLNINCYNR